MRKYLPQVLAVALSLIFFPIEGWAQQGEKESATVDAPVVSSEDSATISFQSQPVESSQSTNTAKTKKEKPSPKEPPVESLTLTTTGSSQAPFFSATGIDVEPSTGSASTSIVIEVPAGRAGIQPNIQLLYNSNSSNGSLGMGWSLELGSIQRSTKRGVPKYDNTDTFVLMQAGSTQELVDISGNGTEFRAKTEGAFMTFKYFNGPTPYWIATDKKGVQYYFGTSTLRQVYEPGNPGKVFKWCLDRVEDLSGNYMQIVYLQDLVNNQLYPQTVNYTGAPSLPTYAKARLIYEDRPDITESYNAAFKIRTIKRLLAVELTVDNNLVRRYNFQYTQGNETGRSLLSSVTQVGSDGATSLPATVFTYSAGQTTLGPWQGFVNPPNFVISSESLVRLMDFNADGLPDILHYDQPTGAYDIYFNESTDDTFAFSNAVTAANGPGYGLDSPLLRFVDLNADGLTDILYGEDIGPAYPWCQYKAWINNGTDGFEAPLTVSNCPANVSIDDARLQFVDMNNDGATDMLFTNPDAGKVPSGNYKIFLNNGAGDFGAPIFAVNSPQYAYGGENQMQWGDFNGDGLLDAIYGGSPYKIWINNGVDGFALPKTVSVFPSIVLGFQNIVQLVDMNGDGLTDLLETNPIAGGAPYHIYFNNGKIDFDSPVNTINTPWEGFHNPNYKMADMNSDGLLDIFYGQPGSGVPHQVWLNNGSNGYHPPVAAGNHPGADLDYFSNTIVDMNGDSLPDLLYASAGNVPSNIVYPNQRDALSARSGTLIAVDNAVGGTSLLKYTHARSVCLAGLQYKIALGVTPFQVVRTTTQQNAQVDSYSTDYEFSGCAWNFPGREFRGFALAKTTDAEGNYSEADFLQDDIFKGRPSGQRSFDASGNLFSKIVNTWDTQEVYPGVSFSFLKRKDNFVYDGDATGRRTAEEYFYAESPQYGNLTKVVQLGEVDLTTGADIGSDSRTVETSYLNNTSNWLLGIPKETLVKDNAGQTVRKSWFYYDGHTGLNTAPIKGQLTKKEDWAGGAPAVDPVMQYTYDARGNLLTTTDPKNNTTTITYDSTYQLFPLVTQNAIGHQVVNEYYGVNSVPLDSGDGYRGLWGQLKSATDPNNQAARRTYDVFGRPTTTVSPLDSIAYPTMIMAYELNSTYVKITSRQRINHGEAATIDSFQFYDGLGRLIQTKTKSETPNQYAVNGLAKYNSRGLPEEQYLPYFSINPLDTIEIIDPAKPHSMLTYDAMGRAVQTTNPDGTFASAAYDDWTTTTVNENGHQQKSYFDAYGRLIKKEEYKGTDGRSPFYAATPYTLYASTLYAYDSEGNLTQTEDAHGNITTIVYDKLGRKISMTDPDMGFWQYDYDLNGNLVSQTDAKNQEITFTYDVLNRLTNKTDGGTLNVNYTYDDAQITFSKERLTGVDYQGGAQNTGFVYDALGRETQSSKQIDSTTYGVGRSYDALNRLISVEYPDQAEIFYHYNDAGQIEKISDTPPGPGASLWESEEKMGKALALNADGRRLHANGRRYYDGNQSSLRKSALDLREFAFSFFRLISNVISNTIGVKEAYAQTTGGWISDESSTGTLVPPRRGGVELDGSPALVQTFHRDSMPVSGLPTSGSRLILNFRNLAKEGRKAFRAQFRSFLLSLKNIKKRQESEDCLSTKRFPALPEVWSHVNKVFHAFADFVVPPAYAQTTDPIAHWRFDEGSGSTANDSSASGYTGSLIGMGAGSWVAGQINGALDFDGVDDYVDAGNPAGWPITSAITVAAWVKIDTDIHGRIIAKHGSGGNYGFLLTRYHNSDSVEWRISTDGWNWLGGTTSADSFPIGQWYHIAATYDGSVMRVYINGQEDTSGNFPVNAQGNIKNSSQTLQIGRDGLQGNNYVMDGIIDDARVYDRALTSQDIQELINPAIGPVGHWTFDEGVGTAAGDSSGNGFNGTLVNMEAGDWTTGQISGALDFDGSNEYVSLGDPAALRITGEITLAAWISPDASNGFRNVIAKGYALSPNGEIVMRVDHGEYVVGSWDDGGDHMARAAIPAGDVGTEAWIHLAGVYDGTAWHLYRNGSEVASQITAVGAIPVAAGWAIGSRSTGTERFFDGKIDDARIYNRGLSPSEISDLYNEGVSAVPGDPVLNTANPGDTQVSLGWDGVTGADGYKVYFGTASGTYGAPVDAGDVGSYTVTGLANGTPCYLAVKAYNASGESGYSNEMSATPVAPQPVTYIQNVDYNAAGQMTRIEYGNGNVTTYTYNSLTLRLERIYTVNAAQEVIQDLNYTYDSVGNILSIIDNVNTADQAFQYDELNRLTQADGEAYGTKTYTYDEIGNITQKDGVTYTYGAGAAGPHAVTSLSDGTTMTYDANGNMSSMTENAVFTSYTYDVENRLTVVTRDGQPVADFEYDGDGGRTKKTIYSPSVATTHFVGSLYEKTGAREVKYVFFGDQRVASVDDTGKALYYHADHLGGTNLLADDTGTVKELTEYKPYGEYARHEKYGSSEEVALFYFTGKRLDDETGLFYYGARYYDPGLGRFLQADTIVQEGGDLQAFNRYSYVRNNPVNMIDPTGHFFGFIAAIFKAVVSFAVAHPVITGAIVGAAAGGIASYQATGSVNFLSIALGGLSGALSGGVLGIAGADAAQYGVGLIILKASAGLSLAAQVAAAAGQTEASRGLQYASLGLAGFYTAINVGIGIKDWLVGKGSYYDVASQKSLSEAEIIAKYGKDGASIHINGVGQTLDEALKDAVGKNVLFYNPTHGVVADFTEAFLETVTFTSSLSRQVGRLATQLRLDMVGYSQGALIASNGLLHAGLNGGAVSGTIVSRYGGGVGGIRFALSARLAGVTKIYAETKPFDPIKLISSEVDPIGYVQGAVGLITGGREHAGYFK